MNGMFEWDLGFHAAAVWIAIMLLLNVGGIEGPGMGETIAKEVIKIGPAGFETHFGLGAVSEVSVMGWGTFAATFRIKLKDGSEFALKVAKVVCITPQEKKAMIELKKKKLSFIPTIIEDFSKESVKLPDGIEYATLASTLTGPDLKKILQENGNKNFPVDAIRSLACQLEKVLTTMQGVGWCHNDIKLANIAINGEAGKQDRLFLLDFGESSEGRECRADFRNLLDEVLKPLMALYNGESTKKKPISNGQFKLLQTAYTGSNWVEFRRLLNEEILGMDAHGNTKTPGLLTAWQPGKSAKPPFLPVTKPFGVK